MFVSETPLFSEWDKYKNTVAADATLTGSQKKRWWLCSLGHSFEMRVGDRFRKDGKATNCPVCAGKKVLVGFNDVASLFPELAYEWVAFISSNKDLTEVTAGSNYKAKWRHLVKGTEHFWVSSVANRTVSGQGCPICAGKQILAGFNDFASVKPDKIAYWNFIKNKNVQPSEVAPYSHTKVWWQCEKGHEWEAPVSYVSASGDSSGCPVCAGKKVLIGFNDFSFTYPNLVKFWDVKKNGSVSPNQITSRSNKKVWWKCDLGHSVNMTVSSFVEKKGACAICKNNSTEGTILGNSVLLSEWNYNKNGEIDPRNLPEGTHQKVWWVCNTGHEWVTSAKERLGSVNREGTGCPVCSNKKIVVGINDLPATHPELIDFWDISKNRLTPEEVTAGSGFKVWWQCEEGHSSHRKVLDFVKYGCLDCVKSHNSLAERNIYNFIKDLGLTPISGTRKIIQGKELDIYVPEKNIAVEFNGLYWHSERKGKDKWYHYNKWKACKDKGIQLIQVWEDDWNRNPDLVKRMLAHKLGVSELRKISGHHTKIVNLTTNQIDKFLSTNHIQETANGSIRLGLVEKNNPTSIVAVMVLKIEPGGGNTLSLLRYATSVTIRGGFTKMLAYVEKNLRPEKIITFSDNCVSDGGLYSSTGFEAVKSLPPDYMYVVKNKREHKFGYRLKKFRNDNGLLFQDGLTEKQLAELNGLERIWDSGKIKWVKVLPK